MLRHLEIVKSFHSAGKDGVEYDYQFRRLKSRNSDMVWGEFISELAGTIKENKAAQQKKADSAKRSEEHTSELQSLTNLVCRLLLEKKKQIVSKHIPQLIISSHMLTS